jgi:hypothetical protein
MIGLNRAALSLVLIVATGCASAAGGYKDPQMDFGAISTVAVMPLANASREQQASERVRDVLMNRLLASYGVYVLPPGEVARSIAVTGIANPTAPTKEEVIKFGTQAKVDAVITGVIREYGEVRSTAATANVLSLSVQMTEVQTGRVVLSVSSTQGGINFLTRLFGGGGEPMNDITEKAVEDVINKIFEE